MRSTKPLYVIKVRDAKRGWFIKTNAKGEIDAGWAKVGWVTTFQAGIMAGRFDITVSVKSAMKYPTKDAAVSVGFKLVAQFPDLIGHLEVRRVVSRKKGSIRTKPCRRY